MFEKTPRISLSCKLVPVYYREYEYGLLDSFTDTQVGGVYSKNILLESSKEKFPTLNLEVM